MLAEITISSILSICFIALYSITIIGLVLIVLLENRNPLKTIPWVIVLLFIPGIGLLVYYFFGRDNRRLRIISRRVYKRFQRQAFKESARQNLSAVPKQFVPLAHLLKNSTYSAIFGGSEIEIFTDGQTKFDRLIRDLSHAQHHIHLQYYIFENDRIGIEVCNILKLKAKEGVTIRIIYDDVGSWNVKQSFFQEMKESGIEIYPYLKVVFPILTSKVNYRNHRKNVVIDGKTGYIGGMNIADRYVYGNKLGIWRDTHFRITGPGVGGLQSAFLLDWYAVSNKSVRGKEYYPVLPSLSDMKMQIVMSDPSSQWRTLLQAYIFTISNVKQYIYIQTPYFLPTEGLNQALQMAALGNIDVRLMLPKKSDTLSAQMATMSYIQKMLEAGVKIYFYTNGFLHSKLLIADDILTCFGSANFDFRSFEHNFEINSFVYQREFTIKMKDIFLQDMSKCEEVTLASWRNRPFNQRLAESFFRLFAPLL